MDNSNEKFYFKMSDLHKNAADLTNQANLTYDFDPLSSRTGRDQAGELYSKNFSLTPMTAHTTVTSPGYYYDDTDYGAAQRIAPSEQANYENNFINTIVLNNDNLSLNDSACSESEKPNNCKDSSFRERSTGSRAFAKNSSLIYADEEVNYGYEDENLCFNSSLPREIETSIYGSETLPENSILEADNTLNTERDIAIMAINNEYYNDSDCNTEYTFRNNLNYNNNFQGTHFVRKTNRYLILNSINKLFHQFYNSELDLCLILSSN
jgi:hypothetical protein